jgi:hypothetical protein
VNVVGAAPGGHGRPADLSSREVKERLGPAAARAFFKMCELWEVRDEDARGLLGGISNGAFYELKSEMKAEAKRDAKRKASKLRLDQDRLTRISILTGMFKALNVLYGKKLADRWVQLANTNPMFAGATPLDYMIKGGQPAMMRVRQLLDSRRGGM